MRPLLGPGGRYARLLSDRSNPRWRDSGAGVYRPRHNSQMKVRGFGRAPPRCAKSANRHLSRCGSRAWFFRESHSMPQPRSPLGAGYYVSEVPVWTARRTGSAPGAQSCPITVVPQQPAYWTTLPMTVDGKLDTSALRQPTAQGERVARDTELEAKIRDIASVVLDVEPHQRIGMRDDLFGLGPSTAFWCAIKLISRLKNDLDVDVGAPHVVIVPDDRGVGGRVWRFAGGRGYPAWTNDDRWQERLSWVPTGRSNPYPIYHQARELGSVTQIAPRVLVSTYAEVHEAMRSQRISRTVIPPWTRTSGRPWLLTAP